MISVAIAVLGYGAFVAVGDWSELTAAAIKLGFAGWTLILGLSLLNYLLRFVRWHLYLVWWKHKIPILRSLTYYLSGFALTTSPGKAGEAVRSVFLNRYGVSYDQSLAAIFVERLLDIMVMAALAVLVASISNSGYWPVVIAGLLTIGTIVVVRVIAARAPTARPPDSSSAGKIRTLVHRGLKFVGASSQILRFRALLIGLTIGIVGWAAEGVAFHAILVYLDLDVGILTAIGIYAAAVLIGALSMIPGGLGSTEAVMTFLLTLVGANTEIAIAATLICRVATLWFAVALGALTLFGLALENNNNISVSDSDEQTG